MYITKFEVKSFRCFTDKQEAIFAIPDKNKVGSGLTFIVGENNCGKTSLLEAMKFSADSGDIRNATLRSSDIRNKNIKFSYYDTTNKIVQQLVLLHQDACTLKHSAKSSNIERPPVFISSRRYWSPQVANQYDITQSESQLTFSSNNHQLRQSVNDASYFSNTIADLFHAIQLNAPARKKFIHLIRSVFPNFQSFTTEHEDQTYVTYKTTDNTTRHRTDFLGDGVSSVMLILAYLTHSDQRSMLIIDEPELSLHPLAQKRLIRLLADQSKKRQIVIATHSPYMIDWEYIKNGAKVNRLVHDGKNSTIYTLKDFPKYNKLVKLDDWHHPFNSNIMAKEIFFSDNILFTEGKDDACLLTNDRQLNDNINIFGYGTGGCGSFDLALSLAKDIGVQKAAVIIDGGSNEATIANRLKRKFNKYIIMQWDRHDIRDKEQYTDETGKVHPAINGYFTSKGKKKSVDLLGDYNQKIQALNSYFS